MADNQSTSNARTYVLVHGAWDGGWVCGDVSNQLTTYGHRVTTPTLTGLGKRSHLVLDVVEVRITDLPITPEKVLAALDRQKSTTK
jgi:hypothetical protein